MGNTNTQITIMMINSTSYVPSWNSQEKQTMTPKETPQRPRKDENKFVRIPSIQFYSFQGRLFSRNSECMADDTGKKKQK